MKSIKGLTIALASLLLPVAAHAGHALDARFDMNRVYVTAHTASGGTLHLYIDSGGGTFLTTAAVARLRLKTGDHGDTAALPELVKGSTFPPPPNADALPVAPFSRQFKGWPSQGDGIFGEAWLGGHIWTWDYPRKRFVLDDADWHPPAGARAVKLGFKRNAKGHRALNFIRFDVRIDGRNLSMLLDTGAETLLTTQARAVLHDHRSAFRATSMIVKSVFDGWHKRHPDWRIIDNAQLGTHAAMIEVPDITIGRRSIGPVWFTERPDANFHRFMSRFTDRRVEGSIGGNALRHFAMTIDYPRATGWFLCKVGCRRAH